MSEDLLSKILVELQDFRQETNERLDKIEKRLDNVESRLDSVESRLEDLESRVAKLEDKVDTVNRQINWQFDEFIASLRVHDKHIRRLDYEVERLNLKLEKGRQ